MIRVLRGALVRWLITRTDIVDGLGACFFKASYWISKAEICDLAKGKEMYSWPDMERMLLRLISIPLKENSVSFPILQRDASTSLAISMSSQLCAL